MEIRAVPMKDIKVRCTLCNWSGTMNELVCKYIPDPEYLGDVVGDVVCPNCNMQQYLDWEEL